MAANYLAGTGIADMVEPQREDSSLPGDTALAEAENGSSAEVLVRTVLVRSVLVHIAPAHIPDRMSSVPVVLGSEIGCTKVAVALEMGVDCIHVAVDHTAAGRNSLGS